MLKAILKLKISIIFKIIFINFYNLWIFYKISNIRSRTVSADYDDDEQDEEDSSELLVLHKSTENT
jgi:hypothetical protein